MPNTSVRAAAEGMPAINRRKAISIAGGGIAALATMTVAAPAPAAQSGLRAVIEAHKRAYIAFNESLGVEWGLEKTYFEANPKEIIALLSTGGSVTFRVDDHYLEEAAAHTKGRIVQRYADQSAALRGLGRIDPELVKQATATLAKYRARDLRNLRRLVKVENAKRDAYGYGPAISIRENASDAERDALTAVCAYHCTSADEYAMKGQYLLSATGGKFGELQDEDYEALLRSFLSDGEA